jgi:hypothetical protein
MNNCFFCGPTDNPLTEEHVWPKWVSKLLKGKYGSDHFVLWFARTSTAATGSSRLCWAMVDRVIQIARLLIVLASRHRSLVFENMALRQQLAV